MKYCGNCYPEIDSARIFGQWMRSLEDDKITLRPEGERLVSLGWEVRTIGVRES